VLPNRSCFPIVVLPQSCPHRAQLAPAHSNQSLLKLGNKLPPFAIVPAKAVKHVARKTKKKKSAVRKSKRGGRKPGQWEHVSPDEIKAYRAKEGMSRAKLASRLGVSTTSIQNWEAGRPASVKVQRELRDLFDGNPIAGPKAAPTAPANEADNSAIRTTGDIVAAYLQSQKTALEPAELAKLVRSVRLALS
jgi:DNA-binding transcriptional regulator YiaG